MTASMRLNGHAQDVEAVHRHVREQVERRLRRDDDLRPHLDELEQLLSSLQHRPFRRDLRVVARTVRVETDEGVEVFGEDVVLPDVKHNFDLVLSMLNFRRGSRGLPEVEMPLFVQPDELAVASRDGVRCLCEDEQESAARARSRRRLGRRGSKRWHKLRGKIFDRDDWKCTRCGAERDLHVHRVAAGDGVAAWTTLCGGCHLVPGGDVPAAERIRGIRSQLALVIKKGKIEWVGLVFGPRYFLLRS